MYIPRDIAGRIKSSQGTYIQVLIGPRQCGKSTLFAFLDEAATKVVTLDDLQARNLAATDPAFFLSQFPAPLIIDEVQYAPQLFPELKLRIDKLKLDRLRQTQAPSIRPQYRLTGSNQLLMDKEVKESLAGRASYYFLNTLSVHEILNALADVSIQALLFKGGWPELYSNPEISPADYLNDYVRTYVEKDVMNAAGITKKIEFHTVLGMLAARTGQCINYSAIAQDAGVRSVTVKEWTSVLERTSLVSLLPAHENNLNKRLIRAPKLHFFDCALAARLQGWMHSEPMMKSPQIGALFETLVVSEVLKLNENFGKGWRLSHWRTKEGDEVDLLIQTSKGQLIALDAKLGIHGTRAAAVPGSLAKIEGAPDHLIVVTAGGEKAWLSKSCLQVPIQQLTGHLLSIDP